jgi:RNA:NAD 2'-phosphotransferase (TPT1/KptA family)
MPSILTWVLIQRLELVTSDAEIVATMRNSLVQLSIEASQLFINANSDILKAFNNVVITMREMFPAAETYLSTVLLVLLVLSTN